MTYAPTEPAPRPRRGRPWSRRTPLGRDIALGIVLFVVEAAVHFSVRFGHGMEMWAAQGDETRIEAARLADLAWMQHFLVAMIVFVVIALLFRAPWTALSQLLAARGGGRAARARAARLRPLPPAPRARPEPGLLALLQRQRPLQLTPAGRYPLPAARPAYPSRGPSASAHAAGSAAARTRFCSRDSRVRRAAARSSSERPAVEISSS